MVNQIDAADFVLLICTEMYMRRFRGDEEAGRGLGAQWEGAILTQHLYEAAAQNTRFIPVVLSADDRVFIPIVLRGATRYDLSSSEGYDGLYRHITDQPMRLRPELGTLRLMPATESQQDFPSIPWNAPATNPLFVGRDNVMGQLNEALILGNAALTNVGVRGPLAVGKTQIAVEYAHRYRRHYSAILWTRADGPEVLTRDLVCLAKVLDLPEKDDSHQHQAIAAVVHWLEANSGWLLVLDGLKDHPLARRLYSLNEQSRILVTTNFDIPSEFARCPVDVMDPDVGSLLLLHRARIVPLEEGLAGVSVADRRMAAQLSEEIGGVPLALDQAGAYIEQNRCSLTTYLDLFKMRRAGLLRTSAPRVVGLDESVAVTLSLCLDHIISANPIAAELLELCSAFNLDVIPEEIITRGAPELGPMLKTLASPVRYDDALAPLFSFSLVSKDSDTETLAVRRYVQIFFSERDQTQTRRRWDERVVLALARVFPPPEFTNWHQCERLLPFASLARELVDQQGLRSRSAGRLLNDVGVYLSQTGRLAVAEQFYESSLSRREELLGLDHPEVGATVNNLAELYYQQGKYDQAEPLFQRSLVMLEDARGHMHPDVATAANNIAALYRAQGRYDEAEPLYERSLLIRQESLGSAHPDVGRFE